MKTSPLTRVYLNPPRVRKVGVVHGSSVRACRGSGPLGLLRRSWGVSGLSPSSVESGDGTPVTRRGWGTRTRPVTPTLLADFPTVVPRIKYKTRARDRKQIQPLSHRGAEDAYIPVQEWYCRSVDRCVSQTGSTSGPRRPQTCRTQLR